MSVRTYQSDSHIAIFTKIYIWDFYPSVGVFRLRLRSVKKQTLYMKTYVPLWSIAIIGLHKWDCVPCEVHHGLMDQFLDTFAKLRKATVSFMFVRPHGTTWLPLDGFSWNLIYEDFMKICRENSSFNKGFYTWRPIHIFLSYLAHFFLEWEMFMTKVADNINKHFVFRNSFSQSCRLWDKVEKYRRAGQAIDDNMAHAPCMLVT
jgi:hypothetical protein